MKILFLISTLANGGAERAMSNITMHLPDGVEADILINSISDHDFPTRARIISLGMKPERKMGMLYQVEANIKRIIETRKLKKENNYDACISFMDSANMCNILTGNKCCKTIVSVRVSVIQDKTFMYRFLVKPMVRLLYNRADYVAAVAAGIKNELIEDLGIIPDKVRTITNGYDVSQIWEQAQELLELPCIPDLSIKYVYVTVGRYTSQKAQWHLIRSFAQVAAQCNDTILLIIGKGEEKEYLETLILRNGMENRIFLIPYRENPFAILNQCDVFVMPSMFEGYCNALCEALICGLPCVATDFQSSAREILAPGTPCTYHIREGVEYAEYGVLTPVCSGTRYKGIEPLESAEQYLRDAMISLYQDRDLMKKYQEQARKRGQQMDIEQKVQEWLDLVHS
ncbi:MAG: glycosyltransferase [Lachnospiraceae bacterium]|nr:glycosyltransferase [Lachnospiraceae bacterium]